MSRPLKDLYLPAGIMQRSSKSCLPVAYFDQSCCQLMASRQYQTNIRAAYISIRRRFLFVTGFESALIYQISIHVTSLKDHAGSYNWSQASRWTKRATFKTQIILGHYDLDLCRRLLRILMQVGVQHNHFTLRDCFFCLHYKSNCYGRKLCHQRNWWYS